MALGSGSLGKKKEVKKSDKPAQDKKSSAQNEAADILKKMDEKAEAGACPFC